MHRPTIVFALLLLSLATGTARAVAPTAAYAPAPDSNLPDGVDCGQPAFPNGGSVELDFGAGGNCTPGQNCNVAVTSNADGSGTAFQDRTFIGCSVTSLSGEPDAVGVSVSQDGNPGVIQLVGSQAGGGAIQVTCSANAQNSTARVCCQESRGGDSVRPFYDVSCPTPTQPEFDSAPGAGSDLSLSTVAGSSTNTQVTVSNGGTGNLVVTAGGLGGSLSVMPSGQQSIAPGGNQPFTVTCAPAFAGSSSQVLSFATNDASENPVTFPVECTGTPPPAPEFDSTPASPGPLGNVVTTEPNAGQTQLVVSNDGTGALTVEIAGLDAPFGASPPSATLGPGADQVFTITCDGSVPGVFFDTFQAATNDAGEASVPFNVNCTVNAAPTPEFGSVPEAPGPLAIATTVGTNATTSLTITNGGDAALQVSLSGLAPPLSVAPGGTAIPPGQQGQFTITCNAAAPGSFGGTLTVSSDDSNEASVPFDVGCEVTAAAAPEINTIPAAGPLSITTTTGVNGFAQVEVQNVGTASLSITGTTGLAAPFGVSPVAPQTIVAGASQVFTVSCNSGAPGVFADTLLIASNDANENPVPISVQCTVNGIPDYSAVPAPPGPVAIATTQGVNGTGVVTVTNAGSGPLTVNSITGLAAPFSASPGNATIAAGASQDFTVTCSAGALGSFNDQMTLNTNDPDLAEAAVSYNVSCNVVSSAGPAAYGSDPAPAVALPALVVPVGSSITTSIRVSNTAAAGAANLTIAATGLSAPLSVSPSAATIAPGAQRFVTVRCTPTAVGTSNQTLIVDTNAPNVDPATYGASCEGTPGPEYGSIPIANATLSFEMDQGSGGQSAILRITNTGAAPLTVSPSELTGNLFVAPNAPVGIAPGFNFPFTVGCDPKGVGESFQLLQFSTNDIDEQVVTYFVSCRVNLSKETRAALRAIVAGTRIPKPDPVFRDGFEN